MSTTVAVDLYKDISQINNVHLKFSTADPFVPGYVKSRLQKSSNIDPESVYNTRVRDRQIILDNPPRDSRLKKAREEKKARRQKDLHRKKLGVIGRKEAELKGVWKLEESQAKYERFLPLHALWRSYMSELLNLPQKPANPSSANHVMPNSSAMHAKLVKADYHGAIVSVKKSKHPCLVGLSGIVYHETENAFKIVTPANAVKLIPKQNSIFTFRVPLYDTRPDTTPSTSNLQTASAEGLPEMEFQLYGNQFRFRAAERAGRKFKHKESIEL